ncbi:MAG: hypothetical protein H0T48_12870 [Gemmatimonadaceae bacterium]|nr:hypothetical protein [Gemmatimonadaceae bacterium]
MHGIAEIVWKSRKPMRAMRNYLSLLKPGPDEYGQREGIFFVFDRRSETITVYWGVADNLDPHTELCEHNAWCEPDFVDAVLTIPVTDVPAVAYALLHVHRRTREHDYQGPDAGLGSRSAAI